MNATRKWLHVAAPTLALAVACAPNEADKGGAGEMDATPNIEIIEPVMGAVLSGSASVAVVGRNLPDDARIGFGLAGDELVFAKFFAERFELDTTAHGNGPQTLVVEVRDGAGDAWRTTVDVAFDNPDFRLHSYGLNGEAYAQGDELELLAEYDREGLEVTVDLSAMDDAASTSHAAEELGGGHYRITYQLSASIAAPGRHIVRLNAFDGEKHLSSPIGVSTRSLPALPIALSGARFIDRPAPRLRFGERLPTPSVEAPVPLIGKASAPLMVHFPDALDGAMDRLVVAAEGFHGYYVLALEPDMQDLELTATLNKAGRDDSLTIRVAAIDETGHSAGWQTTTLVSRNVSLGGLQVTLYWDAPVDLDISVIDPAGTLLDFENPSANGGLLNLDANSLCDLHPSFAENISWQDGQAPVGDYEIRVNLFDACGYEGAINWWIVGVASDSVEFKESGDGAGSRAINLSGVLNSNEVDQTGTGKQAGEVEIDGAQTVGGVVKFKKNPFGTLQDAPAHSVPVRAISALDDTTEFGRAVTDGDGAYTISLDNPDDDDYYVVVEASYSPEDGAPLAQVTPLNSNEAYRVKGDVITPSPGTSQQHNFAISPMDDSGAFNILDGFRRGYDWVFAHWAHAPLGPTVARWTRGAMSGTNYDPVKKRIAFGGHASDPDEFDDSVIMHEFMHYVYDQLVGVRTPGGSHSGNRRVAPGLAFSEGLATAFGQAVLGYEEYSDKFNNNTRATRTLLDENTSPAFRKTHDGTITGNVSEYLVAMVVWDMVDGANEPHDLLSAEQLSADAVYRNLPSRTNRGARHFDLVDLLDAFRCETGRSFPLDADLSSILTERDFPYDFKPDISCP